MTNTQSFSLEEIFSSKETRKRIREFRNFFSTQPSSTFVKPKYTLEEIFASLVMALKINSIKISETTKIETEKTSTGHVILVVENDTPQDEIHCELGHCILSPNKRHDTFIAKVAYTENKGELVALMDQFIKSL